MDAQNIDETMVLGGGDAFVPCGERDRCGRSSGAGLGGGRSGWLSGLGLGASGSPLSRCGSVASIADDIRNDRGLFFADDEPLPPMPISPAEYYQKIATGTSPPRPPRRISSGASLRPLSRRVASRQKMDDLQREVDMALEYFSQETERGLDSDGDEGGLDDFLPRVLKGARTALGGEDDSLPGTATTMATSVFTDDGGDFSDVHTRLLAFSASGHQSPTDVLSEASQVRAVAGTLSLKHRTKSIVSFPSSLLPSQTRMNCDDEETAVSFESVMAEELHKVAVTGGRVDFDANASLRNAMEPFLAVARIRRDQARQMVYATLERLILPPDHSHPDRPRVSHPELSSSHLHIGSSYGVPYPALRQETPFLYDVESFPLGEILAETMGVDDLSMLHVDNPLIKDKRRLMAPLKNRGKRRKFHQCYDSFVASHVIPLLHSQALAKGVFFTNRHQLQRGKPQAIVYRYQAFPAINIVRPGECSTDPHCDMAQGHSVGTISYHVPLTPTFGTNAVYTESRPGREDWHPLEARSPGLGFQFDGARCLHFNLRNETDRTRVSLNFRIAITRAPCRFDGEMEYDPDDQLCCPELLRDEFSRENPGFHEEVVVQVGEVPRSFMPGPVAVKRRPGAAMSVVG